MNNFNEIDIENFYSKIQDEGGYDVECICLGMCLFQDHLQ